MTNFKRYLQLYLSVVSIFLTCFSVCYCGEDVDGSKDGYEEALSIKPLVDGRLFAQFQFKTIYRKDIKSLRWENKFQIFPLSIAELIASSDIESLHFSLTKGNWNYRNWGYSTRPSPPGAQIRAKLSYYNENRERSWRRLVNSLAGKFCASLESADEKILVSSKLAFGSTVTQSNSTDEEILYSHLSEETLCSENFTPWKKLLPCLDSGLASLLTSVNLLKSSYSSLSIDVESIPYTTREPKSNNLEEQVQLTQSVIVVFNPVSLFEGKQTWSLTKIFGKPVRGSCPISSSSLIYVDITNPDDEAKLFPESHQKRRLQIVSSNPQETKTRAFAIFDINKEMNTNSSSGITPPTINIGVKQNRIFKQPPVSSRSNIPVNFRTHIAGFGAGDGTMVATINNNLDQPIRITYLDVVPHFLRVYMHSLTIRTKTGQELKPDRLNFGLSKGTNPTLMEFSLLIPPSSEAQISYDFDRAFLRGSYYKPDANKGYLLGSAMISIAQHKDGLEHLVFPMITSGSNSTSIIEDESYDAMKIYAKPLLMILPTPDFSMPYNVICLVCSVLAAAFGPLHGLNTGKPAIRLSKKKHSEKEKESKKDQ